MLIKVLSSFLSLIPLDGKRGRNRGAFGKKASFKAAFLILPLQNSFEDTFILLLLHPLIVSSSLHLHTAKLGVGVFGKNNARKSKGDNLGSISADKGTRANDLGIVTYANIEIDNSGTAVDNPGTAADDLVTATDDPSIAADN